MCPCIDHLNPGKNAVPLLEDSPYWFCIAVSPGAAELLESYDRRISHELLLQTQQDPRTHILSAFLTTVLMISDINLLFEMPWTMH